MCVAVSPSGQDDGRYITVNIHDGGKVGGVYDRDFSLSVGTFPADARPCSI